MQKLRFFHALVHVVTEEVLEKRQFQLGMSTTTKKCWKIEDLASILSRISFFLYRKED
jgi:hypothetical protein